MRVRTVLLVIFALGAAGAALATPPLRASSGKPAPALPGDFGLLYATLDRGDLLESRELFAPAAAFAAIGRGAPLPAGTVLTMIVYSVKRDTAGRPLRDGQGRFVKDAVAAVLVMRKLAESARPPLGPAQGPWQFQLFGADGLPDRAARMSDCALCHRRAHGPDPVFTAEDMKAFAAERRAR